MNVDLNKTEKKVVSLLIEDSEYTSDELAIKIGVTKRTIERAFISLQNKKIKERTFLSSLFRIIQNYSELFRIIQNYAGLCRITECNVLYCYWQTTEREVSGI